MTKINAHVYVYRGEKARLPDLRDGQLAHCTDTNELFIGTDHGNVLLNPVQTPTNTEDVDFTAGTYTIPGETTKLYRLQNKNSDAYTVVEIANPEASHGGDSESTLTLMREVDSESGGAEFVDFYNNGYSDSRQMGLRVQTRGGVLRPFVFDFFDGTTRTKVMQISEGGITAYKEIFFDAGSDMYAIGRSPSNDRFRMGNWVASNSFELMDDGTGIYYSPTGDFYVYLDAGNMYVNDKRVLLADAGGTPDRPNGVPAGYQFFDTDLGCPIWWNGSAWCYAYGELVDPPASGGNVSGTPITSFNGLPQQNKYIYYQSAGLDTVIMFTDVTLPSDLVIYIESDMIVYNQSVAYSIYHSNNGTDWLLTDNYNDDGFNSFEQIYGSCDVPTIYTDNTGTTAITYPYVYSAPSLVPPSIDVSKGYVYFKNGNYSFVITPSDSNTWTSSTNLFYHYNSSLYVASGVSYNLYNVDDTGAIVSQSSEYTSAGNSISSATSYLESTTNIYADNSLTSVYFAKNR